MRLILAYLPTIVGFVIFALLGFRWAKQEREDPDHFRRGR
jgi:hypothetical protein